MDACTTAPCAAPEEALAPGSSLLSGQYEIVRYLSSGGFGITYLARDSLGRPVVIKECFPDAFCGRVNKSVRARSQNHVQDFKEIVRHFIKEAHALSRATHPSIVGVHQIFEDNETAYMSLDLIDGKDLLDLVGQGTPKLTPQALNEITLKLLDAIDHIHNLDLLHRDISPDNILVDKTGHPVLIDFGAAREDASRKSRVLSSLLVVKDGYSPPEFYVSGSKQTPSSDLYAFAATLYHVITGAAPTDSQNRLAALASDQPDPYQPLAGRFPQYDAAFLEAIDTTMELAPNKRLQSAGEWAERIDKSKRIQRAQERAAADHSIDEIVTKLLDWANDEALKTQALFEETHEEDTDAATNLLDCVARTDKPTEPDISMADVLTAEVFSDEAHASAASHIALHETTKPTPYERVKTTALLRAEQKQVDQEKNTPRKSIRTQVTRFASVPVVFCAFFFSAQTAFTHEYVRAATIQPIVSFGAIINEEIETMTGTTDVAEEKVTTVVIRRGLDS